MAMVKAYFLTLFVFLAIDAVWLTQIAGPFYFEALGDLMREDVDYAVAGGFYLLYVAGVVYFAVAPALKVGSARLAFQNGAVLGLIAYATYDLTNLATLNGWPVIVAVIDIPWGTALTAATGGFGYLATRAVSGRG